MKSAVSIRGLRFLFVTVTLVLLSRSGIPQQVTEPAPPAKRDEVLRENKSGITFHIRTRDSKTKFIQGELITIELLFSSSVPNTYKVDGRTYDRSGHLEADTYHVEPEVGTSEPLQDYRQSGMFGGLGGGLSPLPPTLEEKPYVIAQDLNEFIRFDRPGKYRLYVTNNRIGKLDPQSRHRITEQFKATSNTIEIEILPADRNWQKQKLQEAVAIVDGGKQVDRRPGCRVLRFLNSEDAEAAMIRRYRGNTDGCDGEFGFGLISSPRRESVIDQMESALAAPDHPVTSSFIRTLAILAYLARFPTTMPPYSDVQGDERRLSRWQAEMKERRDAFSKLMTDYAERLSEEVFRKDRSARAVSIETVLQFSAFQKERGTPASVARVNQLAAMIPEIFSDLPADRQYALLTYSWKQIANPSMLPSLRQLIEKPISRQEGNFGDVRGIALRRLYELAPEEGRRAILQEIQRTPLRVRPQALSVLPDETLPELDDLLSKKLAQHDPDQDLQVIADYSVLLARYATSASLPAVRVAVGDRIGRLACNIQAPLLAYFLRVDPEYGGEVLEESLAARKQTRCFESELGEVARIFMSPEVKQAAINHLNDPNLKVSIQSAAVLSQHGASEDEPLLWNRLQQWHDEWQGRDPELETRTSDENIPLRPAQVELELVRAIARGRGWLMDTDKFKRLERLCLTQSALQELSSIMRESEGRDISTSSHYGDGTRYFRVAQYEFHLFADFKEKLSQFPKGTIFKASSNSDEPAEAQIFSELKGFLSERGMKLNRSEP